MQTGLPPERPGPGARACRLAACLLLALAQVLWAGYELGVGNQSIQVPMLLRWADPSLYPRDLMLDATMADYPSLFFRGLAALVPFTGVPALWFGLHLLTGFAFFASVFWLARGMFRDEATGWVAAALLLAGHHSALAGEALSSPGFTHTWVALPAALFALGFAWRGRTLPAAALAGVLWNVHALTAAWLAVFLGAMALAGPGRPRARELLLAAGAFLAASAPTLAPMLARRQPFDADWLALMRLRSAGHIFPSAWWQAGAPDLPRFALLAGLGAMSLGFVPSSPRSRRLAAFFAAGAFLLLAGAVGSEVFPLAPVIRAQLFRSSRLLAAALFLCVAHGLVAAWRLPFVPPPRPRSRWLEFGAATLAFAALAVPAARPLLPAAFALTAGAALASGRLSAFQATIAGGGLLLALAAWRAIGFPLGPGGAPAAGELLPGSPLLFGVALGGALLLAALVRFRASPAAAWTGAAGGALLALGLAAAEWPRATSPRSWGNPWVDAQLWAREHTPRDALFLTPIRPGGFRVHSRRAVVGEWRDGTQLFFNAAFARPWWERMRDLQKGLACDANGERVTCPGTPLGELPDHELLALAAKRGATHLVLPAERPRRLERAYANARWAIYLPRLAPPRPPPITREAPALDPFPALEEAGQSEAEPPAEVANVDLWRAEQEFLRETVLPNIEKHRKGDATLTVVGADGRPAAGLPVEVRQVRQAFGFGCSLGFFIVPATPPAWGDYKPPAVTPAELEAFGRVFNHSLIPFSGKWMHLEGKEGVRWYEDLDRYVEWCAARGTSMEYHFLSGYAPPWLKQKKPEEQAARFLEHARELALRYGDRIRSWQVVNEKQILQHAPPVFEELRRLLPNAELGISDCANFWAPPGRGPREKLLCRGLEEIRWLKSRGVKVDFFGFHGHRPFGVWPDPREMYEVLDAFAREGVRVHVTEFSLPVPSPILGPTRRGTWTPALQAEFYRWIFTVLFSHPAVDSVNLWGIGPEVWQKGTGLLDEKFQPKPNLFALEKLVREEFRTRVSARLSPEGTLAFRGFHGDYEAEVLLPSGRRARVAFAILPNAPAAPLLRLDPPAGPPPAP